MSVNPTSGSSNKVKLKSVSNEQNFSNYREIDPRRFFSKIPSPYPNNSISSSNYSFLTLVPKTISEQFLNISYFWFVLVIIFDFYLDIQEVSLKWYSLISLTALLMASLVQNLIHTIGRKRSDLKINSRPVNLWKVDQLETVRSADLQVGDVILVHEKEEVPVDMLLIAVKEENSVFITSGNLGIACKTVKKTFDGFIAGSSTDQLEILNHLTRFESVSVSAPRKSFQKFKAKIKFRGDPKPHFADLSNLILRGSRVEGAEWVLGISVFCGMDTKVWINSKADHKKRLQKLSVLVNVVHSIHFFITIGFVVVGVSLNLVYRNQFEDFSITESIMWHVVIYGNLISISLFIAIKLARIISALIIRVKTKNIIIDPKVIEELGKVEFVVAEKDEVLAGERKKVSIFAIQKQIFYKQFKFQGQGTRAEVYKIVKPSFCQETLPPEFSLFEELEKKMNFFDVEPEFFNFFLAAQVTSISFQQKFEEVLEEDQEIIKNLEKLGVFLEMNGKKMRFCIREFEYFFKVIFEVHDDNKKRVLIKNESLNCYFFIEKSNFSAMYESQEGRSYINSFNSGFFGGFKPFFFKIQEFSQEEGAKLAFQLKLAKKSRVMKVNKIQQVIEQFVKNLEILGFLGFEYKKLKKTRKTIKKLNNAGIKTWMVTGDSYENATLAAYSAGFFEKDSKLISISNQTDKSLCIEVLQKTLKNLFNSPETNTFLDLNSNFLQNRSKTKRISSISRIQKQKSTLKKLPSAQISKNSHPLNEESTSVNLTSLKPEEISSFSIIIDGDSFSTIHSSKEGLKLFISILFLSKSACFYKMTPDQKKLVIQTLQGNFSFKPTVLAVGDSYSDSGMLDEASISVIVNNDHKEEIYFDPNVFIPSFHKLTELILIHGHYSYVRISKIFHYSIYKEIMICMVLFLYQFTSGFSGASLMDFELFVIFELFVSLLPMIVIGVFEKDVPEKIAKNSAFVYSAGVLNELASNKRLAFYSFIGFFQGIVIFVFVQFGFGDLVNADGLTEDSEVRGTLCFIVMSLSILQKVFVTTKNFSIPNLVSPFFTLAVIVICVVLTYYEKLSIYNNSSEILTKQACFWILVTTLPSFFTSGYFFFSSFYFKIIQIKHRTRFEMFGNCLDKVFVEEKIIKKGGNSAGLEIDKRMMKFKADYQEMKYQEHLRWTYQGRVRVMTWFVSVFMFIYLGFLYSGVLSLEYKNFAIFPALVSLIFALLTLKKRFIGVWLNFSFFLFILSILIVNTFLNEAFTITRYPVVQVLFSLSLSFKWRTTLFQIILCFLASLLVTLYEFLKMSEKVTLTTFFYCFVLDLGISVLCGLLAYVIDFARRNEYSFVQKTRKQFEKSNEILGLLLPQFVKKRVNDGVRYIAEDKGVVSVIFCDICEFDQIIQDYSQTELVSLLDDLFSRFDKICQDVGVSKIETVGKTYLACSGLKDFDSDLSSSINEVSHARRAIEMAFAVLHESKKTILKSGNHLKMKIGIHSGPVVAGVVGYHKPQFSLVGDTVNTASRMASTLETYNNIQISQNTFKLLQDNTEGLHFEPKSPEVKGKGKMKTFLVEPAQTSSDDLQVFTDFSETHPTNPTLKTMSLSTMLKRNEESSSNQDLIKSFNANLTWRQKLFQVLCVETEAEKQFQSLIYQNSYLMQKYGLMVSASVTGFLIVLSSVQYKCSIEYHSLPRLIYFVFEESLTLIFLFFIQKFYKSRIFAYMLNSLYWTEMVLFLILQFIYPNDKSVDLLLFSFRYLLLNFCTGLFFLRSTISNLSLIAVLILKLFFFSPSIETWFFSSFFVLCILHTTFTRETNLRKDYIVRYLLERENEKTEQLLTQMLPFKALRNLKDEITSVDRLSSVTIMYADIVGFTLWSAQRSPADVIGMLSEMFTKFDKMCVEHGLYKVYTIGDCYVAMGHFTDQVKRNPAKEAAQIARFAFSLVKLIQEVNVKISACLNMRIGIHTGNAVGGINGTNVVRYDVYGKDVMIANKMESHGVPGKVTVSEKTKELIEGIDEQEFSFEEFKDVKAWDETVKMFIMNRVK